MKKLLKSGWARLAAAAVAVGGIVQENPALLMTAEGRVKLGVSLVTLVLLARAESVKAKPQPADPDLPIWGRWDTPDDELAAPPVALPTEPEPGT